MIHPNHDRSSSVDTEPSLKLGTQKERRENYCTRGKHHWNEHDLVTEGNTLAGVFGSGVSVIGSWRICFDCGACEIKGMGPGYDWVPLGGRA